MYRTTRHVNSNHNTNTLFAAVHSILGFVLDLFSCTRAAHGSCSSRLVFFFFSPVPRHSNLSLREPLTTSHVDQIACMICSRQRMTEVGRKSGCIIFWVWKWRCQSFLSLVKLSAPLTPPDGPHPRESVTPCPPRSPPTQPTQPTPIQASSPCQPPFSFWPSSCADASIGCECDCEPSRIIRERC